MTNLNQAFENSLTRKEETPQEKIQKILVKESDFLIQELATVEGSSLQEDYDIEQKANAGFVINKERTKKPAEYLDPIRAAKDQLKQEFQNLLRGELEKNLALHPDWNMKMELLEGETIDPKQQAAKNEFRSRLEILRQVFLNLASQYRLSPAFGSQPDKKGDGGERIKKMQLFVANNLGLDPETDSFIQDESKMEEYLALADNARQKGSKIFRSNLSGYNNVY